MGDFVVDIIAATLRIATPLIFATLGELFCERAGILNLGIEGTMFFGAFSGFAAASLSGSLWVGVLTALVGGMLSGWLMSLFAVRLGVNQLRIWFGNYSSDDSARTIWIQGDLWRKPRAAIHHPIQPARDISKQ